MQQLSEELLREAREHRDALVNIRVLFGLEQGRGFLKYLFKSFDVGGLPEIGLEGNDLHERIGVLRAGQSIFKIVAEADAERTGQLIAEIEKEQNEIRYGNPNEA